MIFTERPTFFVAFDTQYFIFVFKTSLRILSWVDIVTSQMLCVFWNEFY